jgi:hypothetical protein
MQAIVAQDVADQVRIILNDTVSGSYKWADDVIVANMKLAERAVKRDAPASAFTTPVAFNEGSTLTPSGTEGALASTDTIDLDVFYQDALTHYTAHLCFSQSTRDTVNKALADREKALYVESL